MESRAPSRVSSSRRASEAAGEEVAAPQLKLPQLSTGLTEAEVKDLAYLVFASSCPREGMPSKQRHSAATAACGHEHCCSDATAGMA